MGNSPGLLLPRRVTLITGMPLAPCHGQVGNGPLAARKLSTRAWGSEQGHGKNRWWALDEPIEERTVNMVTEHCGRQRHMIEPWIFVAEADFQYNWKRLLAGGNSDRSSATLASRN